MKKKLAKKAVSKPRQIKVVEGDSGLWDVDDLKPHPYADKVFGKPPKHEVEELSADMTQFGQARRS